MASKDVPKILDLANPDDRLAYIRDRGIRMSNAKSALESKFQLAKQMYEIFEKHLIQGEQWNQAFRFPEVFGAVQRKYSDLLEALPEVKIRGTKPKSKDFAIASQAIYDHQENIGNAKIEKARAILDTLLTGTGILYEGYGQNIVDIIPNESNETDLKWKSKERIKTVLYDGLLSERIDPRNFYVDESTSIFYDETGAQGAQDCMRRRMYSPQAWQTKFKDFDNFDQVQPWAWGMSFITNGIQPYEKEAQEQKTSSQYFEVLEYWNRLMDMVVLIANGVIIYVGANPFRHKRLPFIMYYNYRRDDSIWGVSEIELQMPFVQFKEQLNNLIIMDAKLKLQPALAVSGDAQFNEEENELQPGAIFTLRGVVNGKVQDNIMPLSFGGIDPNSMAVIDKMENDRIAITGDDTRALYSNPGQLATQTLAKREASQKRIKSNILLNTIESERQRAYIRFSNIIQFIASPTMSPSGKVSFRRVQVEGFQVRQDSEESKPYFTQKYGAQAYFSVNEKVFKGYEDAYEIEIIDVQMQESLRNEQLDNAFKLIELAAQFPEAMQGINAVALVKQIAKEMDIDYFSVFPDAEILEDADPVDIMIELIMMGRMPKYDGQMDAIKVEQRLREFRKSSAFKKFDKQTKQLFNDFTNHVLSFIPDYLERKLATILGVQEKAELQNTGAVAPALEQDGAASVPGQQVSSGAGGTPQQSEIVPGSRSIQSRVGFRA